MSAPTWRGRPRPPGQSTHYQPDDNARLFPGDEKTPEICPREGKETATIEQLIFTVCTANVNKQTDEEDQMMLEKERLPTSTSACVLAGAWTLGKCAGLVWYQPYREEEQYCPRQTTRRNGGLKNSRETCAAAIRVANPVCQCLCTKLSIIPVMLSLDQQFHCQSSPSIDFWDTSLVTRSYVLFWSSSSVRLTLVTLVPRVEMQLCSSSVGWILCSSLSSPTSCSCCHSLRYLPTYVSLQRCGVTSICQYRERLFLYTR